MCGFFRDDEFMSAKCTLLQAVGGKGLNVQQYSKKKIGENKKKANVYDIQWHRAIEALEARPPLPPDDVATLVNSLQSRVKSITLCVILNAKNGK